MITHARTLALAVLTAAAIGGCTKSRRASTTNGPIRVVADDHGFTPSSVTIPSGHAAVIEFTRDSETTCATSVVFPELHIDKPLPLHTPVTIALPSASTPKTYDFACGMGMMKGSVLVEPSS